MGVFKKNLRQLKIINISPTTQERTSNKFLISTKSYSINNMSNNGGQKSASSGHKPQKRYTDKQKKLQEDKLLQKQVDSVKDQISKFSASQAEAQGRAGRDDLTFAVFDLSLPMSDIHNQVIDHMMQDRYNEPREQKDGFGTAKASGASADSAGKSTDPMLAKLIR